MIHIDYLSAIRLSGPDSGDFLQSQLSADIKALDSGQSTFAAYCTPRGQVLGLLLVCKAGDQFVLVAATDLLPGIVQRLKIYVMRSKVEWDESADLQVFGMTDGDQVTNDYVSCTPDSVSLTYAIGAKTPGSSERAACWKCNELLQGVAWLDSLTTEKFIPQMLGQDNLGALSFSKGCYPGQEIVARTRYLGKVKRKPLIVTASEPLEIASASRLAVDYVNESINGTLVDSARTKAGDTVLFIVTNLQDDQEPLSVTYEGNKTGLL